METGVAALDTTLRKTQVLLKEIMAELDTKDRHRAYIALRATLHALRDQLPVEEAVQLAAQLPLLVRGMYYEGWRPSAAPFKERNREALLQHIAQSFPHDAPWFAERVARAVLAVLARHVPAELHKLETCLSHDIRELFP